MLCCEDHRLDSHGQVALYPITDVQVGWCKRRGLLRGVPILFVTTGLGSWQGGGGGGERERERERE
jgi:hypothetical protein